MVIDKSGMLIYHPDFLSADTDDKNIDHITQHITQKVSFFIYF